MTDDSKQIVDLFADRDIPFAHRLYLVLRVVSGLRQRETSRLTNQSFEPGRPLPVVNIEHEVHARRRPIHPVVLMAVDHHVRTSYLQPDDHLFSVADTRRFEGDWKDLFAGGLAERSERLLGYRHRWFQDGNSHGDWTDACCHLLSVPLRFEPHLVRAAAKVQCPQEAIRRHRTLDRWTRAALDVICDEDFGDMLDNV